MRPPPSTSCTWTRCIPRTSCDRKWTMSSIGWPIHSSGASRICVSPWTGGQRGPTYTFGYPPRRPKTPEDRILLYFSDFRNMEERYVLPQALTQKAIAFAAGIQRKHLSRYLDEMVRDGFLTETKAHIEGEKQRMLAYYLAPRGWERAMAIKERLSKIKVPVVIAGVTKDMTIQEIDSATSVHLTFSDIVREAMNVDKLDLEYLEGIDDRRKRAMDERVKRLEDYTRAVMTAWKDGRVTATERLLVEQLRENLGISREEQDRIESQVIEEVLEDRTGIYRAVAEEALEDGPITEDDRELLEALRKKLGLSARDCREIEAEIGKPAS